MFNPHPVDPGVRMKRNRNSLDPESEGNGQFYSAFKELQYQSFSSLIEEEDENEKEEEKEGEE